MNVKTRRALLQLGWTMVESYLPFRVEEHLGVWKLNDTDSGSQESTLMDVMVLDGSRMLALKGGFIR